MIPVYDLGFSALEATLKSWDEPAYRSRQVWQGMYRDLYHEWSEFSNLPKPLRERLEAHFELDILVTDRLAYSSDGSTRKAVFRLKDGLQIETVLMRYTKRSTLCISTQVGCAMGCVFCATGQMGFRRHLSSGEIVAQVMHHARLLKLDGRRLTNIVVMGMGEPLHNYESTMNAIERLNDPGGYAFGARRFTVSTVGLVPMIRRIADERRQFNLAISLHAADDALRASMLPINKKYNIDEVLKACRYYSSITGRRITFEWALIQGINDTSEQAINLATLLKGLLCHVNAIPLNPTKAYAGRATSHERAAAFRDELVRAGVPCTIRLRRGIDIEAGCGQLIV